MKKVTKINWTFHTSNQEGSGTDSRVTIRIFRDGHELVFVNQEPGETGRLDRGEVGTYWWEFQNPTGIGTAVSGQAVPYTEDFPNGVQGHLVVQLEIWSDDEWRIESIDSQVISGKMVGVPGTIDSWNWVETSETFYFSADNIVMSSDNSEGYRKVNLNY